MLFKVLVDGKSHYGGKMQWSLPENDKPGEWHEMDGPVILCRSGFHLTDTPAIWWTSGCTVYVAEAEGVVGTCDELPSRKVAAKLCRLLRVATDGGGESVRRVAGDCLQQGDGDRPRRLSAGNHVRLGADGTMAQQVDREHGPIVNALEEDWKSAEEVC
jgi:hypothetical protein